jgi:hypothetical protein
MLARLGLALVLLLGLALGALWLLGSGTFGSRWENGDPTAATLPAATREARASAQRRAALDAGVAKPDQILFGDLHVHTTFSPDAFMAALPLTGGDGAHPVSDACDFARWCAGLDFFSINDHAEGLTPALWQETVRSIRECDARAAGMERPDLVPFLGWEWTQTGPTAESHFGHRNVVLAGLDADAVPARPIASRVAERDSAPPHPTPPSSTASARWPRCRAAPRAPRCARCQPTAWSPWRPRASCSRSSPTGGCRRW